LNFPVSSPLPPLPPFFVPPDFCYRKSLPGRDRELELLDQKLFKERRPNGTTPVLIHGEPGSGKTELVERYIQLNRMKFTGGVFWINYRSVKEVHNDLRCIALEYMTGYSPGPDVALDALLGAVRTWFEGFTNWLVVLNDLHPKWGGIGLPRQSNFFIFSPSREHCSLIYISSNDLVQSSDLPLKPDSLQVAPLGDIKESSMELNTARSPTVKYQASIELGSIRNSSSNTSSTEGQGGSTRDESSLRTTREESNGSSEIGKRFVEAEEKAYIEEAEDRIDHGKTGLLMSVLSCEHEGCRHVSRSVSEYT